MLHQRNDTASLPNQGRSVGGIWVFIPPKSAQVNFLRDKNDVRTAIQQFYTPQKLLPPKQISGYAPGLEVKQCRCADAACRLFRVNALVRRLMFFFRVCSLSVASLLQTGGSSFDLRKLNADSFADCEVSIREDRNRKLHERQRIDI